MPQVMLVRNHVGTFALEFQCTSKLVEYKFYKRNILRYGSTCEALQPAKLDPFLFSFNILHVPPFFQGFARPHDQHCLFFSISPA